MTLSSEAKKWFLSQRKFRKVEKDKKYLASNNKDTVQINHKYGKDSDMPK
jgi:hypothetical protein